MLPAVRGLLCDFHPTCPSETLMLAFGSDFRNPHGYHQLQINFIFYTLFIFTRMCWAAILRLLTLLFCVRLQARVGEVVWLHNSDGSASDCTTSTHPHFRTLSVKVSLDLFWSFLWFFLHHATLLLIKQKVHCVFAILTVITIVDRISACPQNLRDGQ